MRLSLDLTDEERAYLDTVPTASWLVGGDVEAMLNKITTHWVEILATGTAVHAHDGTGYLKCQGQVIKGPIDPDNPLSYSFSPADFNEAQKWMAEVNA